jgi:hypothetical protein
VTEGKRKRNLYFRAKLGIGGGHGALSLLKFSINSSILVQKNYKLHFTYWLCHYLD